MESKFRKYLRDLLLKSGFPSYSHEHRSGGSSGFPDTSVLVGELLLPVELKLGRVGSDPTIMHISRLRPVQIGWLEAHHGSGGRARLVIGLRRAHHWSAYTLRDVRRARLISWRKGFRLEELCLIAEGDQLLLSPDQW